MNSNFSTMLKTTLTKMKDRINEANKTWEQDNDTKMLEKFKEIVDTGNTNIWVKLLHFLFLHAFINKFVKYFCK